MDEIHGNVDDDNSLALLMTSLEDVPFSPKKGLFGKLGRSFALVQTKIILNPIESLELMFCYLIHGFHWLRMSFPARCSRFFYVICSCLFCSITTSTDLQLS